MLQLLDLDLQNTKINKTFISMRLTELDWVTLLLDQLLLHSHLVPLDKSLFDIFDLQNTIISLEQDTATQIRFIRSFDTFTPIYSS